LSRPTWASSSSLYGEPLSSLYGEPLVGSWYNCTKECTANQIRREKDVDPEDFATEYELKLSPLPCWRDQYGAAEIRQHVADLVEKIEEEGAQDRRDKKKTSLGVKKILRMKPHHKPKKVEKSEKPRFHAVDQAAIKLLLEGYRAVLAAHREASARLFEGDRLVDFPEGTFPPALPFIPFVDSVIVARGQPA
jgi:hypothetical protein